MKNMKPLEKIYFWIILIFMYLPIVTLIVLSFNRSKSRAHWGGFTFNLLESRLRGYRQMPWKNTP